MMRVDSKNILLTGAASGIGRALTHVLLERGARVLAADINSAALEELKRSLPEAAASRRLLTSVVDLSRLEGLEALMQGLPMGQGKEFELDGVINNAGVIQPFQKVHELSPEAIKRVVDVNLLAPLALIRWALPQLLRRPEAHVVNVGSMGGFVPVPGQGVYGATKAALKLLSEALYSECVGTPVRITIAMPGAVATDILKNSGVQMPGVSAAKPSETRSLSARDAALQILAGMEKDQLHVLVGPDSRLLYRLSRWAPKFSMHLIQKQMAKLLQSP